MDALNIQWHNANHLLGAKFISSALPGQLSQAVAFENLKLKTRRKARKPTELPKKVTAQRRTKACTHTQTHTRRNKTNVPRNMPLLPHRLLVSKHYTILIVFPFRMRTQQQQKRQRQQQEVALISVCLPLRCTLIKCQPVAGGIGFAVIWSRQRSAPLGFASARRQFNVENARIKTQI